MELQSLARWNSGVAHGSGSERTGFSVKKQFAGAHVMLTGCTGYIGGLVLESMLLRGAAAGAEPESPPHGPHCP